MITKSNYLTAILASLLIVLVIIAFMQNPNSVITSPTPSPSSINIPENIVIPNSPSSNQFNSPSNSLDQSIEVTIYLIALEDNGKSGPLVGCGDSLFALKQTVAKSNEPLKMALNKLLSIKSQYYGQSGLYNSLFQSDLTVESISLDGSKAAIYLSGSVKLAGECDNQRFIEQLKQTALQFPSIKEVSIYINNKPIEEVVNLKGFS